MPQFEGAAGTARPAQRQDRPGRRDRCRQRHRRDRRGCRQGDRRRLEIRAEEQHRRDHQLRHGADAPRYRRSQADGARRRREAGKAEVGVSCVIPDARLRGNPYSVPQQAKT